MIECFTIASEHLFDDARYQMHKLRHDIFIKKEGYQVPTFKDLEYDNYDTPAATYLVYRDDQGIVKGTCRMLSTVGAYMLKDVWPDLTEHPLPSSSSVWETTRFGVDIDNKTQRGYVIAALLLAKLEYAMANNIQSLVAVTTAHTCQQVLLKNGWSVHYLGQPKSIEGFPDKIMALSLDVNQTILDCVRQTTGIHTPMLSCKPLPATKNHRVTHCNAISYDTL